MPLALFFLLSSFSLRFWVSSLISTGFSSYSAICASLHIHHAPHSISGLLLLVITVVLVESIQRHTRFPNFRSVHS